MKRIWQATLCTIQGLRAAHGETAFRQELLLLALSVPLAFLLAADNWKRLVLIAVVLLVLVVELLNTAIEKLADRVSREHDPLIGAAKDIGSAAVAVSLLLAGLFWLLALYEAFVAFS